MSDEVWAKLMEFPVPCLGCMSGNCPYAEWYIRTGDVDVGCAGSGVRYPLRRSCWCMAYVAFGPDSDHGNTPQCKDGYLFNTDPNALWEAVRAKGWRPGRFEFQQHGDLVTIEAYKDWQWGKRWEAIGVCDPYQFGPDEGLCGTDAWETALLRAMERED